jgi:hypothetical protein
VEVVDGLKTVGDRILRGAAVAVGQLRTHTAEVDRGRYKNFAIGSGGSSENCVAGDTLRPADAWQESRVRVHRDFDDRNRYRSEHRALSLPGNNDFAKRRI